MTDLPALSPNAWLRWDVVSRLLPAVVHPGADVLEVGCGQGGFGVRLALQYRYVGVEPDPISYDLARTRLAAAGAGEVRHGDLAVLRPEERFDLVCAFEVIEHIEDDRAALRDWVARLRPGGVLLLPRPRPTSIGSLRPTRWSATSAATTRRCYASVSRPPDWSTSSCATSGGRSASFSRPHVTRSGTDVAATPTPT